ncbi:hypothetical protein Taro_014602 [Colocasia esculenta]|uniref:Uncharacterized protein n=1 Tax=Colocasia esculenta TaxID=4460 RepID=A0A843UF73_COLES|nr:hypothetical protein [Colocasia esculenta]
MVCGRRSGMGSTSSRAPSTSVGRGTTPIGLASLPTTPVRLPYYAGCPGDRVRLPYYVGCPSDRVCHPYYGGCPDDMVRLLPSSVTCPIPFSRRGRVPSSSGREGGSASWMLAMLDFWVNLITSNLLYLLFMLYSSCRKLMFNCRGKIDLGPAYRFITLLLHAHIPGPVDSWKEFPLSVWDLLFDMFTRRYMFTRPEDLLRARVVWESTAQTNFTKSMWEVRDKAAKSTGSQDPTAWMDYGLVWMRRDYWESLCHCWATGPWQERSQEAKHNRAAHLEKNVHTSGSVSYETHSQKLETYDRMMADRYAEGIPQQDLDPEAWVDAAGGSSVWLLGQLG